MRNEQRCLFCTWFQHAEYEGEDEMCLKHNERTDQNHLCQDFDNYLDSFSCECPVEGEPHFGENVTFRICEACEEFSECWRND